MKRWCTIFQYRDLETQNPAEFSTLEIVDHVHYLILVNQQISVKRITAETLEIYPVEYVEAVSQGGAKVVEGRLETNVENFQQSNDNILE